MKDQQASYPQLRFKGFTDPWEERKFLNLAEVRRGLTYKPSDVQKYGIRVLRSSNIAEDTFLIKSDDVFVNKEAVKIDNVKNGDILITSANGSSRLVGKHALIEGIENDTVHGGFMLVARAEKPEFVNAIMSSSWYSKFINIFVSGGNGAIGNLSKSDLEDQKVYVPSEIEQTKIGLFFKGLDDTITLHQRKLAKLKELKQGYLQKLFPRNGSKFPQLRFAGFADAWEQRKLTEIVNRVNKSSNSDVLPKVEFEDIVSGEGRLNKDISSKLDSRKGTLFESENILYGKLRPYLKNWLFPDFEGVALGDFWVFEATDVSVPSFDYYLIQSDDYQKVANDTSGTKMPRSDWKNVSSTDFAIPSKDEQKQIGAFFKQLDDTITLHQRKLEKLQELKKGYLQKMFC
jgi:type I restriction enzyme S subunit